MGLALLAMVAFANLNKGESVLTPLPFALVPLLAGVLSWLFFRALDGVDGRERPAQSRLAQRLL
jgi:hypothetical protein